MIRVFDNSELFTLNRLTYVNLRWIAFIGQIVSIFIVEFILNFKFNYLPCLAVISLGVITNIYLQFKIKENQIEPDFVSALKLCKRRRIGPLRPESNRELFYKKDMGILARGGFNFDLSKRVLELDSKEFNKLIKII